MRPRFLQLLVVLLAGCAGYGTRVGTLPEGAGYRVLSRPAPLPRGRVTADCGPEALAAVLRFHGRAADVDEITARIYRRELQGTLSTALAPAAREKGLAAELAHGSRHRLRGLVDEDTPSIIMVEVRPRLFHFFVVVGYNDERLEVVCEDYDGAKVLVAFEELEKGWSATQYFLLELRPADARRDAAVAAEFEEKGDWKRAIEFYRRALSKDAKSVDSLIGLGNCLRATGDAGGARASYEQALPLAPADPLLCNNLADLYVAMGQKPDEALQLAERAAESYERRLRRLRVELGKAAPADQPALKEEILDAEFYLGGAFGTLGQARAANGRLDLAIAAWKASLDVMPLTEFDRRAARLLEIGEAHAKLGMPRAAREEWTRALEAAKDPALRKRIEEKLKP